MNHTVAVSRVRAATRLLQEYLEDHCKDFQTLSYEQAQDRMAIHTFKIYKAWCKLTRPE